MRVLPSFKFSRPAEAKAASRTLTLHSAAFSACTRRYPDEPRPSVKTSFPAPGTKNFKKEMSKRMCTLTVSFPVDLRASVGNIVADTDGNKLLDIFCSVGTNAMGYNHPKMMAAAESELMQKLVATRTAIGVNPVMEQNQLNEDAFMSVAPPGMDRVTSAMCGTCSNEGAIKVAMMAYRARQTGETYLTPTPEELCSCMVNQAPGSPNYAVLSLQQGFHGRMLGALTTTRTKSMAKVDTPGFDWPASKNPLYKYPLDENEDYNREQDRAALADMRYKIEQWRHEKGSEVVAVIMEPIQGDGGDNFFSAEFAQGVRDLTSEMGIFMIIDEVQTGVCGTGRFWAHEHWGLSTPPDFVTFAKRMLSCGFYHRHDTRVQEPYRHFNTFFGDATRAVLTATQNQTIKEDGLETAQIAVGEHLKGRLRELERKYPTMVQQSRGLATFMGFSAETTEMRDALLLKLKSHGVNQGHSGSRSCRIRPTLYFEKKHANIYCDALDKACADLVGSEQTFHQMITQWQQQHSSAASQKNLMDALQSQLRGATAPLKSKKVSVAHYSTDLNQHQ